MNQNLGVIRESSLLRALLYSAALLVGLFPAVPTALAETAVSVPLPEHPRPDFEREKWVNLNGPKPFRFDESDVGEKEEWFRGQTTFPDTVVVPFPWGSELSQLQDKAPIGWYSLPIQIPAEWSGQRVFLVIGACDWETKGWIDGTPLGSHRGGYTPFEFELTSAAKPGQPQQVILRVDDAKRAFKLEGKQGYGNARGIWQTAYLEARPLTHLKSLRFTPNIDSGKVTVDATFSDAVPSSSLITLVFATGEMQEVSRPIPGGSKDFQFDLSIPKMHLWSLEDPFLYELTANLHSGTGQDRVKSYFGMRKISVTNLPGTEHPYIALNNKPVYLQITLDQSYHPGGFYTFPSDEFMRDEILRSRRIGLNANRFHVKVDVPRKIYWADRLGLLVMADVPNSWGEPDAEMRGEIEYAMRQMIQRDFNHPSIFAWVPFNETWGLFTKNGTNRTYLPETQEWVASMYRLAKQLDPSRLVEDNSPCNFDHVETDINSWHAYLPGFEWKKHLDQVTADTYAGSTWNYIGGRKQGNQPLLNSECGNVWGYEGSTGDVDWSWEYHIMMNEFRRHPKVCGWLYTEHHDVINEWNGYYRFDRSEKDLGLAELVPGMSLRDLHSAFYLAPAGELCTTVKPGEHVSLPLWASFLTDHSPGENLRLRTTLSGWNTLGQRKYFSRAERTIPFAPWMSKEVDPLELDMPAEPCLALLTLTLEDAAGTVLHRNFTTYLVSEGLSPRDETLDREGTSVRLLRFAPGTFASAKWSGKQWNVLDGLKVNGAGEGYFEYRIPWPADLDPEKVASASLVFEASAKRLNGKDRDDSSKQEGDFMLGKGTFDPSLNPNSYPMTDTTLYPSAVRIRVSGISAGQFDLPDDPADHRGILSWHSQLRDRKLREAGSYGYLIQASVPEAALLEASRKQELTVRFEVDPGLAGGLALYGERFGRYPLDPTLVFTLKK